ncbi:hypothetical protein [Sulfurisphaera ohwakuensis]|uniref:hypothetical protein n=1 Tax=Sulfurisphaera ohwakuensis TaxID=69656 RepID=UPI0036F41F01
MELFQCRQGQIPCPYCGECVDMPDPSRTINIPIPNTNIPLTIPNPIEVLKSKRPITCRKCTRRYYLFKISKDRIEDFISSFDFSDNVITEAKHYKISKSKKQLTETVIDNILGITEPVDLTPSIDEIPDEIKEKYNELHLKKFRDVRQYKKSKGIKDIHIVFKNPNDKKVYFLSCTMKLFPDYTEERICYKLTPVVRSKKEGGKYG